MLVEYWDVMREYRAMQIRNEGGWTRDDTEPVNKSLGEYKHEMHEANKRAADVRNGSDVSDSSATKAAATSSKQSAEPARTSKQV